MSICCILRSIEGYFYNLVDESGEEIALVVFDDAWAAWPLLSLLSDDRGNCKWELVPAAFSAVAPDIDAVLNPGRYSGGMSMSLNELVKQL